MELLFSDDSAQNHMEDLEAVRGLVRNGNYEALSMLYESVPEVLSELIRTAFVVRDGYKFMVSDFSAIEAMVLSWLAGKNGEQRYLQIMAIFIVRLHLPCLVCLWKNMDRMRI